MRKLQRKRPKHLDLLKIRQPLPAVISILHRVSGALLFFPGIPILLYGLQKLLGSPQSYSEFQAMLASPLAKGGLIVALWFFLHHFFAGIRFLGLDLHYYGDLPQARLTSKLVLAAGIIGTLLIGAALW